MLELPITAKIVPVLLAGWLAVMSPIPSYLSSPKTTIETYNEGVYYDYVATTENVVTDIDEYGILFITVTKNGKKLSYIRPAVYKGNYDDNEFNVTDDIEKFNSWINQREKIIIENQIKDIKKEIANRHKNNPA